MKKVLFIAVMVYFTLHLSAQTPKAFKWVAWKSVSASTKAELKKMIDYGTMTMYDDIIEKIEAGCTAKIAVLDMDGDGKMEYAVNYEGEYCCGGTAGCETSVYKDGGQKQIHMGDPEPSKIKPAKNGIISSVGVLIRFQTVKLKQ